MPCWFKDFSKLWVSCCAAWSSMSKKFTKISTGPGGNTYLNINVSWSTCELCEFCLLDYECLWKTTFDKTVVYFHYRMFFFKTRNYYPYFVLHCFLLQSNILGWSFSAIHQYLWSKFYFQFCEQSFVLLWFARWTFGTNGFSFIGQSCCYVGGMIKAFCFCFALIWIWYARWTFEAITTLVSLVKVVVSLEAWTKLPASVFFWFEDGMLDELLEQMTSVSLNAEH